MQHEDSLSADASDPKSMLTALAACLTEHTVFSKQQILFSTHDNDYI